MRASELGNLLAQDAKAVAAHLLPNGKEQSGEWCVGSIAGEEGKSLKVRLTGRKAGTWKDFAEGGSGDLLDLWREVHGLTLTQAMDEVRDYLGVHAPRFDGAAPQRPHIDKPKCQKPQSWVYRWLTEERKISPEAIAAYKIGEQSSTAVFPYIDPKGELMFVKYREAGSKKIWAEKGGVLSLFGWQAVPENDRYIIICEGELDALAWRTYGYTALSVPNGATAHTWIDNEFENLQRFDVIFLSFDMDTAGRQGLSEVIKRLGDDRCMVIELPEKDANECLMAGVTEDQMASAIGSAKTQDPDELRQASEYAEEVVSEFYPGDEAEEGIDLPWKNRMAW
ncbi:hypothetical protein CAI21_21645 [Alkalilimnicola ehrlichii]|uniref:toprim domain-containing protein n=1 Tax=Alkalilimnicola ehrlichii TaxID=351052 RepID=UPI000E2EB445|nr:toprim domain-containing protein [Alkalilimnicola ehrlichii]RFA24430.1 hypothetical protein CAI21_21645 [Alkalilimnicola ehrlichii]